jgi:drug/metabolite transporter (DMT)-like permease
MTGNLLEGIREISHYRTLIAVGLPALGGALVVASSVLMPRGKAKGLLTGAYMLLASLGAACLLIAVIAAIGGEPSRVVIPLLLPGIVLTVIMGMFSPAVIREYQDFEFRKLAAEIFRRS